MFKLFGGLLGLTFLVAWFAAWLTHVVTCLHDGLVAYLLIGALFFPIGIVHGVMIWLGVN